MNIAYNVERARRFFPNKVALRFEGRSYTYQDLDQQVNRMANGLRSLGIGKGDRVAIYLPNCPEFVISYLAILKLGGIAVSVNAMLKREEVLFILQDSGSQVIVTTEGLRPMVPFGEAPDLRHIIIAEGEKLDGIGMADFMALGSSEARALPMEMQEPASIVYTSGTTGIPKGATLSHGNVISNAYSKVHYCGMRPSDRMLLYLPMFHCFGQNAILNSGLFACATLVLQRRFDLERTMKMVSDEAVTMFFAVPTIYVRMLSVDPQAYDLSSVRYYLSGAAVLHEEIARRWLESYGQLIYVGYGLTETSPFASYNHDLKYKFGSVGTAIENVEMKIVSIEDGQDVEPGTSGEIVIRGPNVMLGYWNRPEETAQALQNGWFHSGDIGVMDEEGYFFVVDRLKDMINVSGFKVYPAEVENVLYRHPAVAEAAVYGVPDVEHGEYVKARIVLKPGFEHVSGGEIILFCREHMAVYKAPRSVEFVSSIPKNAPGKVLKRVIRQEDSGRG